MAKFPMCGQEFPRKPDDGAKGYRCGFCRPSLAYDDSVEARIISTAEYMELASQLHQKSMTAELKRTWEDILKKRCG